MRTILLATGLLFTSSVALATEYRINVSGIMMFDSKTITNLNKIRSAGFGDKVIITIDSPGGSVDVYNAYSKILKRYGLTVEVYVYGMAASAAAVLSCHADVIRFKPGSWMMFHMLYNVDEKGNPIRSSDFVRDSWSREIQKYCSRFLTEVEIKDIENDKDVYIREDVVRKRLV